MKSLLENMETLVEFSNHACSFLGLAVVEFPNLPLTPVTGFRKLEFIVGYSSWGHKESDTTE